MALWRLAWIKMGESQGVLPSQEIRKLIEEGFIKSKSEIQKPNSASLDLTLGTEVFRLKSSALLESGDLGENIVFKMDAAKGPVLLEPGVTYLMKIRERMNIPEWLRCYSNPKSTSGRLDVLASLVGKGSRRYDSLEAGFRGELFLEVRPQFFPVVISEPGISLNQIRFFRGDSDMNETAIRAMHAVYPLVFSVDKIPLTDEELVIHKIGTGKPGIIFTLDLKNGDSKGIVGYKARRQSAPIVLRAGSKIPMSQRLDYNDYFEPIYATQKGELDLEPGGFYILATKERVRLPKILCATLVTQDVTMSDYLRTHFAGFFDPYWGEHNLLKGNEIIHNENKSNGKPITLEVRVLGDQHHKVIDGQEVSKAIIDHMAAVPDEVYGLIKGKGMVRSNYNLQEGATLAKYFKPD